MSGELLRSNALFGEVEKMKALLVGGANPCSVDEAGLNPLHLAVWNGKTEATLLLLANPIGSNEDGIKVKLKSFSRMGFGGAPPRKMGPDRRSSFHRSAASMPSQERVGRRCTFVPGMG
eukprot:scaffold1502_cov229-Pinguiococcus_pyrenoidosus.AAC.4